MNPLNASRLLSKLINEVEAEGMTLSVTDNPQELIAARDELAAAGKSLSKLFDPAHVDLVPDRFMCVKGTDTDASLVHIQAVKLDDTGRSSLGEFLTNQLMRGYPADRTITDCHALSELRGRCAYQGETWISPNWRKKNIGVQLNKIGMLAGFIRFSPDYMYGFFEREIVDKGIAARFWYYNYEYIGRHFKGWLRPNEFFTWMPYQNIVNLIELEVHRDALESRPR